MNERKNNHFNNEMVNLLKNLENFINNEVIPSENLIEEEINTLGFEAIPPTLIDLQDRAKQLGFWNLFLKCEGWCGGYDFTGPKLSVEQYAHCAEIMGRSLYGAEACNCNAPDSGNMEMLVKYGNEEQKRRWLRPLMEGRIKSAFLMTEPDVASSDATNIRTKIDVIERNGKKQYQINGRKWWSSGACSPICEVLFILGLTINPNKSVYNQHSIIIVPKYATGVEIRRPLHVFGYNDAPHGHAEIILNNIIVDEWNIILGEGKGFEIAQGRLGPGRVHHCMRAIGLAERGLETMIDRCFERDTFGLNFTEHGMIQNQVSESRCLIEQSRLLVIDCAKKIDLYGSRIARKEISMIKAVVPKMACKVLDDAIQIHGGLGVCQDTFLARAWAGMRTLRIADGPDEVHLRTIARLEFKERKELKEEKLNINARL